MGLCGHCQSCGLADSRCEVATCINIVGRFWHVRVGMPERVSEYLGGSAASNACLPAHFCVHVLMSSFVRVAFSPGGGSGV